MTHYGKHAESPTERRGDGRRGGLLANAPELRPERGEVHLPIVPHGEDLTVPLAERGEDQGGERLSLPPRARVGGLFIDRRGERVGEGLAVGVGDVQGGEPPARLRLVAERAADTPRPALKGPACVPPPPAGVETRAALRDALPCRSKKFIAGEEAPEGAGAPGLTGGDGQGYRELAGFIARARGLDAAAGELAARGDGDSARSAIHSFTSTGEAGKREA